MAWCLVKQRDIFTFIIYLQQYPRSAFGIVKYTKKELQFSGMEKKKKSDTGTKLAYTTTLACSV